MNTRSKSKRCLVLASRHALEHLEPAIDQVLTTLDLSRVWPPSPSDMLTTIRELDVILADVSRPSPALSFELGLATALGVPIAYVAAKGARVSPVFGQVSEYPRDAPVPKLAFLLAKEVDRALTHQREHRRIDTPSVSEMSEYAMPDADANRPFPQISIGERYNGLVVHVDVQGGFVLVGSSGRLTAMLHARNMQPDTGRAFEEGRIIPGDPLMVEVIDIDRRRRQVQLRDVAPFDATSNNQLGLAARLYRSWAVLEPIINAADEGSDALATVLPHKDADLVRNWRGLYGPEFAAIRDARNRLAHSEDVSYDDLMTAVDYAEEALRELDRIAEYGAPSSAIRATDSGIKEREASRARLDALAPRVVVLCDDPDWPPLVDRRRSRMPYRNEPRLLSSHSLHGSPHAVDVEWAFDRDRDQFLWFCCQGLVRNDGKVTAKVRLNGEAQFVKLRTDEPSDPRKRGRLPLSDEDPLDQERVLLPGQEVFFEWAAGRPLREWAHAYERPDPPNPNGALFFSILVSDPTGLSVNDEIFIEAAGRPIEPVPGTNSNWRLVKEQAMRTVVYPTVRHYVNEPEAQSEPPWLRTYAAFAAATENCEYRG